MLNNNSRHRIQVVAWNNEIERIQHHIQPNKVNNNYYIYFLFTSLKITLLTLLHHSILNNL